MTLSLKTGVGKTSMIHMLSTQSSFSVFVYLVKTTFFQKVTSNSPSVSTIPTTATNVLNLNSVLPNTFTSKSCLTLPPELCHKLPPSRLALALLHQVLSLMTLQCSMSSVLLFSGFFFGDFLIFLCCASFQHLLCECVSK